MKNLFFGLAVIIIAATSCATTSKTEVSVTTRDVTAPVIAATIADLEVSPQKISYTHHVGPTYTTTTNKKGKKVTTSDIQYGTVDELIRVAISEALKANGDADVLVEPHTTTYRASGKLETITVTGYPAKYKNFRNPDNETLNKAIENGTLLPGSPSIVVQK